MAKRLLLVILVPILLIIGLTALATGLFRIADLDLFQVVSAQPGMEGVADIPDEIVGIVRVPLQIIFVLVIFLLAWLISRISLRLAGLLLRAAGYEGFVDSQTVGDTPTESPKTESIAVRRRDTMQQLLASLITISVFTAATIMAISQFVSLTNLAVVVTILSTAFGFAARDYIGDFLNGISNIFENRFAVGEKVAVFRVGDPLEGIVEQVTVRTMNIRTRSGELVIVPQGEVRILRNYSRGSFTGTTITCRVQAADLPKAMTLLQRLAGEAPLLIPELIAPWVVISQEGAMSTTPELLVHARATYGHGAEVRLEIMRLIEERFSAAGIHLAG